MMNLPNIPEIFQASVKAVLDANIRSVKGRDESVEDIVSLVHNTLDSQKYSHTYIPALYYQATYAVSSQYHHVTREMIRKGFEFKPGRNIAGMYELSNFLIPFLEHLSAEDHVRLLRLHFSSGYLDSLAGKLQFFIEGTGFLTDKVRLLEQKVAALNTIRKSPRPITVPVNKP